MGMIIKVRKWPFFLNFRGKISRNFFHFFSLHSVRIGFTISGGWWNWRTICRGQFLNFLNFTRYLLFFWRFLPNLGSSLKKDFTPPRVIRFFLEKMLHNFIDINMCVANLCSKNFRGQFLIFYIADFLFLLNFSFLFILCNV